MDELLKTLVKEFDCKIKYTKKLKYMYICETNKGAKLIKPVTNTIESILFIDKIKTNLKNQGFNNIDFYHKSKRGLPYVFCDGLLYVMTDYFPFEEISFSNQDDILNSVKNIAKFHKLCQGTLPPLDENKTQTLDIKTLFEKKLQNFDKMKKLLSKQKNLSDFDVLFIKNYNYFKENAFLALELLNKYNYSIVKKQACKKIMLCHNKLKEENILKYDNNIFIYNLENMSIDHFINDIYKFLIRFIKKHEQNPLTLSKILNEYTKINHIDNALLPILYAMMLFPERYINLCELFYNKKRNFIPIYISRQLENILFLKDYHQNFIKDIAPY